MIFVKSHGILSNLPYMFGLSHRFQSTVYGIYVFVIVVLAHYGVIYVTFSTTPYKSH